jgi:quinol monooxygenase YgiN
MNRRKATVTAQPASEQLWTLGIWTAKAGQEQAFRDAWTEFADWTARHQRGAGQAWLLQDSQQPQRFISFGPWESPQAVDAWRSSPEFGTFVGRIRELCAEFQPFTLRQAVHIAGRS